MLAIEDVEPGRHSVVLKEFGRETVVTGVSHKMLSIYGIILCLDNHQFILDDVGVKLPVVEEDPR